MATGRPPKKVKREQCNERQYPDYWSKYCRMTKGHKGRCRCE